MSINTPTSSAIPCSCGANTAATGSSPASPFPSSFITYRWMAATLPPFWIPFSKLSAGSDVCSFSLFFMVGVYIIMERSIRPLYSHTLALHSYHTLLITIRIRGHPVRSEKLIKLCNDRHVRSLHRHCNLFNRSAYLIFFLYSP